MTTPSENDEDESLDGHPIKCVVPDLEVVVGHENPTTFHCHSVLLASYSHYIDAMLATPMKEQQNKRITFPDMEPSTWKLIMKLLDTGGWKISIESIANVLPHLDRYEFTDGLHLCHQTVASILSDFYQEPGKCNLEDPFFHQLATAVVLLYQLQQRRPFANPKDFRTHAVFFAKRVCKYHFTELAFQTLLPLLQQEKPLLRYLVGDKFGIPVPSSISIDDMRRQILDESFVSDFMQRDQQLQQVSNMVRHLNVEKVTIHGTGAVDGDYELEFDNEELGVQQYCYLLQPRQHVLLRACDPFGCKWEIAVCGQGTDGQVVWRWNGLTGHSSLVPPQRGWVVPEGRGLVPPTSVYLHFNGRGW